MWPGKIADPAGQHPRGSGRIVIERVTNVTSAFNMIVQVVPTVVYFYLGEAWEAVVKRLCQSWKYHATSEQSADGLLCRIGSIRARDTRQRRDRGLGTRTLGRHHDSWAEEPCPSHKACVDEFSEDLHAQDLSPL